MGLLAGQGLAALSELDFQQALCSKHKANTNSEQTKKQAANYE